MHNFKESKDWQNAGGFPVEIYAVNKLVSEEKFGLVSQARRAGETGPYGSAANGSKGFI